MEKILTRRTALAGSLAAAASLALSDTASADTPRNPPLIMSEKAALLLARMQTDMDGVHIMEILTAAFAPHYRKGDLIFVKQSEAAPSDHVYLQLKSGPPVFGSYVHKDGKSLYVCGFKSGDRLKRVPFTNVKQWGKIVISWRA
jgi:hypothetical protein